MIFESYVKNIKKIAKEIKRLYRVYKDLSDTDKHLVKDYFWYLLWLILIPMTIVVSIDKIIYYLLFIPVEIFMVILHLNCMWKNRERLIEMSTNFKYYGKQIIKLLIKIYATGGNCLDE